MVKKFKINGLYEFLNEIKYSGITNHWGKFKVGVPIMVLRNIDQPNGIYNSTRLQVNDLAKNVISATTFTCKCISEKDIYSKSEFDVFWFGIAFQIFKKTIFNMFVFCNDNQ